MSKRLIIKALDFLAGRTEVVLDEDKIKNIIFHRGRALLLNRVIIRSLVNDKRIIGEFTVTNEACEGHAPMPDMPVLKASDLFDMAAQLLGIWGSQHARFAGMKSVLREYGGLKSREFIVPGNTITMEMKISENDEGPNPEVEEMRSGALVVTGRDFSVWRAGKLMAQVFSVSLSVFAAKTLARETQVQPATTPGTP